MNNDDKNASVLNNYFFNAIGNIKGSNYSGNKQCADKNIHPELKTVLKHRKNPSLDALKSITTWKKLTSPKCQ